MSEETWDMTINENIETPKEMLKFYEDIEQICKKHNLSISHEDCHGGFIIEKYKEFNMRWLKEAMKNY